MQRQKHILNACEAVDQTSHFLHICICGCVWMDPQLWCPNKNITILIAVTIRHLLYIYMYIHQLRLL